MIPGFTTGVCPAIQQHLVNLIADNAPEMLRTQTGYINALTDAYNKSGTKFEQTNFGEGGKYHKVKARYTQRTLETDIITSYTQCLTDGVRKTPDEVELNLTQYHALELKFNLDDLRYICEGDAEFIQSNIANSFNALVSKINKAAITLQLANLGTYVGGATSNTYNILAATVPVVVNTEGLSDALLDYALTERIGAPIIVSGKNFYKANKMMGYGCCNDGGVDISRFSTDYRFFYDPSLGAIFDVPTQNQQAVMLAPGAVQLMEWEAYPQGSSYMRNEHNYETMTLVDPVSGLKFDFKLIFDVNCGTYLIRIEKWWDLLFQPAAAIGAGDPLVGTNGTLRALFT